MKNKISIIGSGNIGGSTAHLILQKELAGVMLVDIVEGLPQGKALDLGQSAFIEGYKPDISGTNDYADIKDSDIVFVTAGLTRKPGMDRLDLLKKNAAIIEGIAKNIVKYCPDSIIIMMTNPVDVLTYHIWKISGFSPNRVMGQAGVLDTSRLRYHLSKETKEKADTVVLGGHGDTMLPVYRDPLIKDISKGRLDIITEKTRKGGAEIVSLMKTSAFYAPAAAAVVMIEAVLKDKKQTMPVSAYLQGQYGINDVYIGVPAVIGRNGVEKILEIDLTETENQTLKDSAAIYKESIKNL